MSPPPSPDNDDWTLVQAADDESLSSSSKDRSAFPTDSDATTAQPPNPSQLTQSPELPEIFSTGDFYENAKICRSREGSTKVTTLILPKEGPTPGSVLIIPFEDDLDGHRSNLVVNAPEGHKRYSFAELENVASGIDTTDPDPDKSKGWIAYADDVSRTRWWTDGLFIWGDHDVVVNGDGTKSIKFRREV